MKFNGADVDGEGTDNEVKHYGSEDSECESEQSESGDGDENDKEETISFDDIISTDEAMVSHPPSIDKVQLTCDLDWIMKLKDTSLAIPLSVVNKNSEKWGGILDYPMSTMRAFNLKRYTDRCT